MEQIYHIYITNDCDHKCPLCCNRLYNIDQLPVITVEQLKGAHTVCITGGEPFLHTDQLLHLIECIRQQYPSIQKLYVYTSGGRLHLMGERDWKRFFTYADGLNVAPKSPYEYKLLHMALNYWPMKAESSKEGLSNRLYVFPDLWKVYENEDLCLPDTWQVIGREWDKEFNTPENEHFVRLPILY